MNAILVSTRQLAASGLPSIVRDLVESAESCEIDRVIHMNAHGEVPSGSYLLIVEYPLANTLVAALTHRSSIRLVVWSRSPSQEEMALALRLGAAAYLPATLAPMMMRRALQLVIAGGRYYPQRPALADSGRQLHEKLNALTPRQVEVLSLVAAGKLNKEIAQALGMSAGTVKVHVTAILKTLKMRNRTEAAIAMRDFMPSAIREARLTGEPRMSSWID